MKLENVFFDEENLFFNLKEGVLQLVELLSCLDRLFLVPSGHGGFSRLLHFRNFVFQTTFFVFQRFSLSLQFSHFIL